MPAALFISPHLDDAAFSCGGTAALLADHGWRVVLATVFTLSVPHPRGFALACQTDKGIPPQRDYMALRRAEDRAACRELGTEPVHLPYPEAPHRGYESAPELFSGVRPDDEVHHAVRRSIDSLIRKLGPDLVFAPQGLGGHVDHVQLIRGLEAAGEDVPDLSRWVLHYRDTPYAMREPSAAPYRRIPDPAETAVGVRDHLPARLRSCEAYVSQLDFQFGGVHPMRAALAAFSRQEGERLGCGEPAEAFLGLREAVAALREAAGVEPRRPGSHVG